eukprot:CAMPEP_0115831450 /NCGR_PEP_ID=MMETSP0287-20121206/2146_1 /TAXON_ID=412157 /ORGANISM="Chrysochromulina rotalis, Strain UIO044" /LENGTH=162 /DNA_ID=CAMNT_0003284799 /DNA_START=445 /DNA_END=930 /DNA_ORIENTATION=+
MVAIAWRVIPKKQNVVADEAIREAKVGGEEAGLVQIRPIDQGHHQSVPWPHQLAQLLLAQRAVLNADLILLRLRKEVIHAERVGVECLTIKFLFLVCRVYAERHRAVTESHAKGAHYIGDVDRPDAGHGNLLAQLLQRAFGWWHAESTQDHLRAREAAIPVE